MRPEVRNYYLNDEKLPWVTEPMSENVKLDQFLAENKEAVLEKLYDAGAILFRNFRFDSVDDFSSAVKVLDKEPLNYEFRSTPRAKVKDNLLTSTEYPAKETIPMHNEVSYSTRWPLKLWFYCETPAQKGGETPLVDSRKMFQALDKAIIDRFDRDKLLYVRNYHSYIDLPWQEVFQTTDKSEVYAYCMKLNFECEWITDDHLRTRHLSQAIAVHPRTKETVWFNQAHLFHLSHLNPQIRETLINTFGLKNLPRNVVFGNREPIEDSIIDEIRTQYDRLKISFPWRKNDVLLTDNMLVAHGRHPYEGPRKIIVAMSEEYDGSAALLPAGHGV